MWKEDGIKVVKLLDYVWHIGSYCWLLFWFYGLLLGMDMQMDEFGILD